MSSKIVICGAGQVGFNIARYLSHYDVQITCIDTDRALITEISDKLDVQGICGSASHPDVLERANIRNADVFLAVTRVDEVNMVACEIAHALFDVKTKIARIRDKAYLKSKWARIFDPNHLSVDVVISPELEVARSIAKSLTVPGAFAVYPLCDDNVIVVGVKCLSDTPVVNTPISHISSLFPEVELSVIGIIRNQNYIIPSENEILRKNDELYFSCATSEVSNAMQAFIQNPGSSKNVMIFGGGNIGLTLAQEIEAQFPKTSIRLVEKDKARAEAISRELAHTVVINGEALDGDILKESGVASTDIVFAVTADDRVNTLSCLLAKHHGARYVQALVNNRSYAPLITSLGIDALINPRAITVSRILEYIRHGKVLKVFSIRENFGEIIEVQVNDSSELIGMSVAEVSQPGQALIGAIYRGGQVLPPSPDESFQNGDRIVMMVASHVIPKIEKLISESISIF